MVGKHMNSRLDPHYQSTLAKSVTLSGHGVHSGLASTVTIHPAEVGEGIVFIRSTPTGEKKKFHSISAETGENDR